MKTLKNYLIWAAMQSFIGALIWFGLVEGVEGARNVYLFIVWFVFVLSWAYYTETMRAHLRDNRQTRIPLWLRAANNLLCVGALIWFGCFWTAAALLIGWFNIWANWKAALAEPEGAPA